MTKESDIGNSWTMNYPNAFRGIPRDNGQEENMKCEIGQENNEMPLNNSTEMGKSPNLVFTDTNTTYNKRNLIYTQCLSRSIDNSQENIYSYSLTDHSQHINKLEKLSQRGIKQIKAAPSVHLRGKIPSSQLAMATDLLINNDSILILAPMLPDASSVSHLTRDGFFGLVCLLKVAIYLEKKVHLVADKISFSLLCRLLELVDDAQETVLSTTVANHETRIYNTVTITCFPPKCLWSESNTINLENIYSQHRLIVTVQRPRRCASEKYIDSRGMSIDHLVSDFGLVWEWLAVDPTKVSISIGSTGLELGMGVCITSYPMYYERINKHTEIDIPNRYSTATIVAYSADAGLLSLVVAILSALNDKTRQNFGITREFIQAITDELESHDLKYHQMVEQLDHHKQVGILRTLLDKHFGYGFYLCSAIEGQTTEKSQISTEIAN